MSLLTVIVDAALILVTRYVPESGNAMMGDTDNVLPLWNWHAGRREDDNDDDDNYLLSGSLHQAPD